MNPTSKVVIAAIIGIAIGAGGAIAVSSGGDNRRTETQHMMPNGQMMGGSMMQSSMNGMMASLEGKTGDTFDQAFLSEMVMHHQGAVQMAQMALQNARHDEIRDLAQAIITAQNKEIAQMQNWHQQWYGSAIAQ